MTKKNLKERAKSERRSGKAEVKENWKGVERRGKVDRRKLQPAGGDEFKVDCVLQEKKRRLKLNRRTKDREYTQRRKRQRNKKVLLQG